jgi:hypothetical protein
MARTAALRDVEWEAKRGGSIYFARPFGDGEILTVHPDREPIEWALPLPATFGVAAEADHLSEYLMSQVIRSIEGLADPYGIVGSEDPFEYRSVPMRRGRIVHARVRYGDRQRPMPIEDE